MSAHETTKPNIPSVAAFRLQQAFKLALSMVLLYWLALGMNWDMPKYGALAIALISLDTTGASLHKGVMRMIGTTVGLAVGLLGLALFAQDGWCMLVYQALYLVVVGYFMPTSRYPYGWYVAGFLPSLVWATTYGKVDDAFHYAVFRYLETSAGVIIFTVISTLLWPRTAGNQLIRQGSDFCTNLRELLRFYRCQLMDGESPAAATRLRNRLPSDLAKLSGTLESAYADTPSVSHNKRAWEFFRVDSRAVVDAMELWRQTIDDYRRVERSQTLPHVRAALDKLDRRLGRIDDLWRAWSAGEEVRDTDDNNASLHEPLDLGTGHELPAHRSHFDRAALLSFAQQLTVLDVASRELLGTTRVLAGIDPVSEVQSPALPSDLYQPARWDPRRLVNGLLPAVCFVIAYFFWIHFDPPTGPSVPNMAATLGLSIVLTPMSATVLVPLLLVVMWGFVAPVYFLVMPQLDTGPKLLTLIFIYSFVAGSFHGRMLPFKTLALALFVMMTGISNQQSYSFMGFVDAGLMMAMALACIAIVQSLFTPLRPEQIVLSNVRLFFRGCANVVDGFGLIGVAQRAKGLRIRKQSFKSLVLPSPGKIQAAQTHLDGKRQADNPPETMQRLVDNLRSITNRLQALEIAHDRMTRHSPEVIEAWIELGNRLRDMLRQVFDRWATQKSGDAFDQLRLALPQLSDAMQQDFDALVADRGPLNPSELAGLYAILGSTRGLVEAMSDTQVTINQVNWQQLSTPRF